MQKIKYKTVESLEKINKRNAVENNIATPSDAISMSCPIPYNKIGRTNFP
jgi:hypothetical protein